jgi:hypothetical protein
MVRDGANRERQVRARVPIRNGKHVDTVQLASLMLCILARSDEGASKAGAVQIPDLHVT